MNQTENIFNNVKEMSWPRLDENFKFRVDIRMINKIGNILSVPSQKR